MTPALSTLGVLALLSVPGVIWAIWLPRRPRRTRPGRSRLPGALVTEFRDCPTEGRTRAVIVRRDGTGLCDCGATIPTLPLITGETP